MSSPNNNRAVTRRAWKWAIGIAGSTAVVLAITIAGLRLSSLIMFGRDEGEVESEMMMEVASALLEYQRACGSFPTTQDGIAALKTDECARNLPRYIPVDPWNRPYVYISHKGEDFSLRSLGMDPHDPSDDFVILFEGGELSFQVP